MDVSFAIIAAMTLVSGVAAICLRQLVHCALFLALSFAGLAMLYLHLDAEFVGLAQILVYIGAVAILILFAILLTRSGTQLSLSTFSSSWAVGLAIALAVFGVLAGAIMSSSATAHEVAIQPELSVDQIGRQLMGPYIVPLEVVALLLTVALIGAAVVALQESKKSE